MKVLQNEDLSEWGYASGEYNGRATLYRFNNSSWTTFNCMSGDDSRVPSRYASSDIVPDSGIGWFAGYYSRYILGVKRKVAFIRYLDDKGIGSTGDPFPINGWNIYHRPITNIDMSSDTMGWAVGENQDSAEIGSLYQYPYPNYTIMASPEVRAVRPGSQTSFAVNVNSIAAGSMTVDLSVTYGSCPVTITSEISQTPISPTIPATITFTIPADAPPSVICKAKISGSSILHSGDNNLPVSRDVWVSLWITDHPITEIVPDHGPSGTIVTITGENLGADPGAGARSTANNHVVLAGAQIPDANVVSWSPTGIQVLVPNDVEVFTKGPVNDIVQVTSGGSSSSVLYYQLENEITSVDVTRDGTNKTVTIHGTSFGADPGSTLRSTELEHITLDGVTINYANVVSWSNSEIVFQVSSSTALNGKQLYITSNGFESNKVTITDGGGDTPGWSGNAYLPFIKK